MSGVEDTHVEKETLGVSVYLPGHDPRVTTSLFVSSKKNLEVTADNRCYICGCTSDEVGPLEAHHHPIERSFAEMIDWQLFAADCQKGLWGLGCKLFNWSSFLNASPFDPYKFVDDMRVNGLLICKKHHIGNDEGIHAMPFPMWIAQKYGKEGYKFSDVEIIHHEQNAAPAQTSDASPSANNG